MKYFALLCCFFIFTSSVYGQVFTVDPVQADFYYPKYRDAQKGYKTYSTLILDTESALEQVKIRPSDIARNHIILPHLNKVLDSADLRIYVFVGAYELEKAEPHARLEEIMVSEEVSLPKRFHFMKMYYELPIYMHVYDCTGEIVWAAKADQSKVFYFGEGFTSREGLEQAWQRVGEDQHRLALQDGLSGQLKLWSEDVQKQFDLARETEDISLLIPRKKEALYPDFFKGVQMSKTVFKELNQKKSHRDLVNAAAPVIKYWETLVPTLSEQSEKIHAAGLYNLALLHYGIDQLEEAEQYLLDMGKEYKYNRRTLAKKIQKTRSHFSSTGFVSRQIYSTCAYFLPLNPNELEYLPERMDQQVQVDNPRKVPLSPDNNITRPSEKGTVIDEFVSEVSSDLKALFKKEKPLEDGMVFFNNKQLLQGQITGNVSKAKTLKRGILFTPYNRDGRISPNKEPKRLSPKQIKRFVSNGRVFESHKAGTLFFRLINRTYFMEVLEDGHAKILYLRYRKRNVMGAWLYPFNKWKIVVKLPGKEKVIPIRKFNVYEFLKDAPPVLEKFEAGLYDNKTGRKKVKQRTGAEDILSMGLTSILSDEKLEITRSIIRDYNAYISKKREKAKTGGFKVN